MLTQWLRVLPRRALGVSDVSSKLSLLAAQLREEINFPVKAFQVLSASGKYFPGIYWDQGVNKLVNSVAYIK